MKVACWQLLSLGLLLLLQNLERKRLGTARWCLEKDGWGVGHLEDNLGMKITLGSPSLKA